MKKRNYLILILSVIFLLTSCGSSTVITSVTSHTSTIPTSSNSTDPHDYTETPDYITSIQFDSIQEVKEFVENYDLSKYSEKDKRNIGKALDSFHANGYLIYMESNIVDEKQSVSIYPQYGDISPAISYSRIYTENNSYQFRVSCAETEFLESAKETNKDDWELEYYIKRYNLILEKWEVVDYDESNLGIAKKLYIHSEYKNMRFWIDDTHHVTVNISKADREALIEFAKTLTFEKVPLEK